MSETKHTPFRDALRMMYLRGYEVGLDGDYEHNIDAAYDADTAAIPVIKDYPAENTAQELLFWLQTCETVFGDMDCNTTAADIAQVLSDIRPVLAKATKKGD